MKNLVAACCLAFGPAATANAGMTPEELAKVPGVTVASETAAYRVLEPWEVSPGATLVDGPFGFRVDNQCGFDDNSFCCQLDLINGCLDGQGKPVNGGPYYARDESHFSNDLARANLYWAEFFPADMPDAECEEVRRTTSSALLPRMRLDQAFFLTYRRTANFGNLCDHRGEVVNFCVSSLFALRKAMEDEQVPWVFTYEGRFGALDSPGFDVSGVERCSP